MAGWTDEGSADDSGDDDSTREDLKQGDDDFSDASEEAAHIGDVDVEQL